MRRSGPLRPPPLRDAAQPWAGPARGRRLPAARLGAVLPLLAALLCGCGQEEAALPPASDAGVSCVPGSQGCRCDEANTCDRGLLCNSGRCLPTEGSTGREPAVQVPVPLPPPPVPSAPDASTLSPATMPPGTSEPAPDASAPDASAPPAAPCDGGPCDAGAASGN